MGSSSTLCSVDDNAVRIFRDEGFLVVHSFLTLDELEELRNVRGHAAHAGVHRLHVDNPQQECDQSVAIASANLVQRGCIVETLHAHTASLTQFAKARRNTPRTLRTLLGPVAQLASSLLGCPPFLFNEQARKGAS